MDVEGDTCLPSNGMGLEHDDLACGVVTVRVARPLEKAGLVTWNKPAFACLTSRFPYHTEIDIDTLKKIEMAEEFIHKLGFYQCRVRYFGDKVTLEVEKDRVKDAFTLKEKILDGLKKIGFENIEIDPEGYRTGRMNLLLKK